MPNHKKYSNKRKWLDPRQQVKQVSLSDDGTTIVIDYNAGCDLSWMYANVIKKYPTTNNKRERSENGSEIYYGYYDESITNISRGTDSRTIIHKPVNLGAMKLTIKNKAFKVSDIYFDSEFDIPVMACALIELRESKIISNQQYNELYKDALQIHKRKSQEIRQYFEKRKEFISHVIKLLPDNYKVRENNSLISLCGELADSHDKLHYEVLKELDEALNSFFKKTKISTSAKLFALLEGDKALINGYYQYVQNSFGSILPIDFQESIGALVVNLRNFVKIFSVELYNRSLVPSWMSDDLFNEYMDAYIRNDEVTRVNILTNAGATPITLIPGALDVLFPKNITEQLASNPGHSDSEDLSSEEQDPFFEFFESSEEDSEGEPEPILDMYHLRKKQGADHYLNKLLFKNPKYAAENSRRFRS